MSEPVTAAEWGEVMKTLLPMLNMMMEDHEPTIFESPHFVSIQWQPQGSGLMTMSYDDRGPSVVVRDDQ